MALTISVSGEVSEIVEQMQRLVLALQAMSTATEPGNVAGSSRKSKGDKSSTAKAPSPKESTNSAVAQEAATQSRAEDAQAAGPDFSAVSNLISRLVQTVGKAKTVELLKTFNASKASEMEPDQYPAFIAKGTELLTATERPA